MANGGLYDFLFEREQHEREYNCSEYSVELVPIERRQHWWLGLAYIGIGCLCEVLYVPCMVAIRKHMDITCYNFMFYIAFADMACLLVNALVTGYLTCVGAVFCSSPTLIFVVGSIGLALWTCETVAEMMLAFNRCVELLSVRWAALLFGGKRVYVWLCFATGYGLYFALFTRSLLYSGLYSSWFFNPHIGYIEGAEQNYNNSFHTFHNFVVISVLTSTYMAFAIILYRKSWNITPLNGQSSYKQKMVFVQVVLISSINAVAATIFVLMQFTRLNEALIVVSHFAWILAHGIPPLIYLALNRTVRRDVFQMLTQPMAKLLCILPKAKVAPVQHQNLFQIANEKKQPLAQECAANGQALHTASMPI